MKKIKIELQLLRETSKKHGQKSKSSSCSCFLLELLFMIQKTAPARGAVQEPPGIGIATCLRLARHLFSKHFLERLFSQKYRNLGENASQNGTNSAPFLVLFRRKANMQKVCWDSSENPSGRVLGGPKITKKTAPLQTHILQPCFFSKKLENLQKTTLTWVPKRKLILGVFALGRSWGTFGATVSFLTPKMEPKCSTNDA